MAGLITPKRVFFDTNHLIEMSKVQAVLSGGGSVNSSRVAAYHKFLEALRLGAVYPVIGYLQPDEWVKGNREDSGQELARVLDLAERQYEALDDVTTYVLEAVAELLRIANRNDVNVPPPVHDLKNVDEVSEFLRRWSPTVEASWQQSGLSSLLADCRARGSGVSGRRHPSAHNLVRCVASVVRDQPHLIPERIWSFRTGFGQSKESPGSGRASLTLDIARRLRRVPVFVEITNALGVPMSEDRLPDSFSLDRCPTLALWSRLWTSYVRGRPYAKDNDVADHSYLPVYTYSDAALTERSMRSLVTQAEPKYASRVFADPEQGVAALGL